MTFTADKRIYVNREYTQIVPEDYPEGAILLVPEGGTLTDEDAARWGLAGKDPGDGQPKPTPEEAAGHAQVLATSEIFPGTDPSGKAVKGSKNKAVSGPDDTKAVSSADAPAPDVQMLPKDQAAGS